MLFNPSHPGEVLKDYLGDMTVKEAARRLGVTRPNLSRIRTHTAEVGVMEKEAVAGLVEILVDVIEPVGVEAGGAAFQAVDLVTLGEEKLRQIGAVLTGAAGD
jgi:hypothetical protein